MVTLRTRAPGVDLVAAGVTGQPQVRRVANTAALPPASGGHLGIVEVRTYDRFAIGGQSLYQQLLALPAVTILLGCQRHHAAAVARVAARGHVAELHLAEAGQRGVARTRARLTRDAAAARHQPRVPGTRAPGQQAVALAVRGPEYLDT